MQPKFVTDADMVFGGNIDKLLLPYEEIPDEFKNNNHPWVKEVERLFFHGGSIEHWHTKAGIDRTMAINHFKAVICSFQPKHEHKIYGLAYLLDQWFELKKI